MRLFKANQQTFLVLRPNKEIQGVSYEQMEAYFLISAKELQGKIYSKRQLIHDFFSVDEAYTKYSRHYLLNGVEYEQYGELKLCEDGNYKINTCDIQRIGLLTNNEIKLQAKTANVTVDNSKTPVEAPVEQKRVKDIEMKEQREWLKNQSPEVLSLWAEICQRLDSLVLYNQAVPVYSKSALKALKFEDRPSTYIVEEENYFDVTDCLKKSRDFFHLITARLYILLPSNEPILIQKLEDFDQLSDGQEKLEAFLKAKRLEINPELFKKICINLNCFSLLDSEEK